MNEDKLKLKKRIEHWAIHNDEHTEQLKKSVEKAIELELHEVAKALQAAANSGQILSNELRKAQQLIGA